MNHFLDTDTATTEPEFEDIGELFGHPSDRFIDAFGGCCASLAVLLNTLAYLEPPGPLDASNDILCRLCVVAGTVGYPVVDELARSVGHSDFDRLWWRESSPLQLQASQIAPLGRERSWAGC